MSSSVSGLNTKKPYIETPLIDSLYLSEVAGCNVKYKLEMVQPSGSFKSRGLGYLVEHTVKSGPPGAKYRFFSPSGGNAGCATAYAAKLFGQNCTVCVPKATNKTMIKRIEKAGADVIVHGEYISDAIAHLKEVLIPACTQEIAVFCHPYNNPLVWEGNKTLATELVKQCGDTKPDAVICSIGGGGMYNGLVQGFQENGWDSVPILAVETEGACTLKKSIDQGGEQYSLPKPQSIAVSLSTPNVTLETINYAMNVHPTKPIVIQDRDAAYSMLRFAEDHKLLVEAGCGTALAPIYCKRLKEELPELNENSLVIVIVCGGTSVNFEMMDQYVHEFNLEYSVVPSIPVAAVSRNDTVLPRLVHN